MDTPKVSLKLLVDNKASRVLFAEAPKEFVDFLFCIFSMPFGTLFEFDQMVEVGSLGKLKDSIEGFHENYLQPGIKVDNIFKPKTAVNANTFFLSNSVDQSVTASVVYRCPKATTSWNDRNPYSNNQNILANSDRCGHFVTMHVNSSCPCCYNLMNVPMTVVKPNTVAKTNEAGKNKIGYVKEVMTYMVMDDLVVKPMSTISSITLLNKCGVNDLSQLEEKTVSFGKEEGMKLLNASLKTDKVLTTIFMP